MRGVKFESEISPVAAARPTNRKPYMAELSEDMYIVRSHKRLSTELCLRSVGHALLAGTATKQCLDIVE